jgi:serine protease Do
MGLNLSNPSSKTSRARALVMALVLAVAVTVTGQVNTFAQQPGQENLPSPADLSRTFVQVAKQVKPAVVHVEVVEKTRPQTSRRMPEGFPQIPGFPPFGDAQPRRQKGAGSGVIISPDGYILTNNHVAGDAEDIKVKLGDGREMKARLVGADQETDLAVIKIDAQGLPFARLGDSEALEQGEWVIALGSPFGLQQTMTAGIVSATGRAIPGAGQFTSFIQTDASINPGNSGGPLVNMKGEVVGINTMIFSRSGGSEGIGFAIPARLATGVYAQLIKNGRVTRGYLGVTLNDVTPAVARAVGYTGKEGAIVNDLAKEDAPAAKAGLRSGDVIVEFDGKPVKSPKQLTEMVADTTVGKMVQVKYVRDSQVRTTTITLAERPSPNAVNRPQEPEEQEPSKLGFSPQNITADVARELKLKISSGVLVRNVEPGSPAAEAGIQPGDVIHRIGRTQVTNVQDLVRVLKSLKDEKEIVFQIESAGQLRFVSVTLE